mmetsp:Transcript_25980/g.77400  ORF Transcript_25980/g.77400 Transcript_25980/m.77400 type:complete len:200 (+) Transcript_25980:1075-1674(+)
MPTADMYSEQYWAALSGSGPRGFGRKSMMVILSSGKKCSSSVAHSTPMKPAPTMRTVAFFAFSAWSLWYSSRTWRRRPSMKRSSMCFQSLCWRASSCTVGNHSDSPMGLNGPKLQPEQIMQNSKPTSSVVDENMVLMVAVFSAPFSCFTSPQMNFTPMERSSTGWSVKVRESRWQGFTKARRTPGVYSKYSFASTTVTK